MYWDYLKLSSTQIVQFRIVSKSKCTVWKIVNFSSHSVLFQHQLWIFTVLCKTIFLFFFSQSFQPWKEPRLQRVIWSPKSSLSLWHQDWLELLWWHHSFISDVSVLPEELIEYHNKMATLPIIMEAVALNPRRILPTKGVRTASTPQTII